MDCVLCRGKGKDNGCPYCGKEVNMSDMVNHPPHYTFGKIEVIDVIEDWQLGFHEANCIKYIARAKYKGNELEDLKKAQWYLNRRIEGLEKEK